MATIAMVETPTQQVSFLPRDEMFSRNLLAIGGHQSCAARGLVCSHALGIIWSAPVGVVDCALKMAAKADNCPSADLVTVSSS